MFEQERELMRMCDELRSAIIRLEKQGLIKSKSKGFINNMSAALKQLNEALSVFFFGVLKEDNENE